LSGEANVTVPAAAEILVIGGGPAGSCAATLLTRRGYDVVLIDKVRHPRETVGESVLPSAWKYFDLLGVTPDIQREGFVKKAGGVVVWGDEITQISFRDFAYDRPGLHVERAALDHLLLKNAKAAGVRVFEGMRAESFATDDAGGANVVIAEGNSSGGAQCMRCRFLIDATGQASLVARQFGTKRLDPDFRFVSIWGYFEGSRYVSSGGIIRPFEDIREHAPMTFVSHLGGWGWAWHIPMRAETSVGIVVPIEDYKQGTAAHGSLEEYFLATCGAIEHLGDLLSSARLKSGVRVIRDFSYGPDRIAGPGYFVIGDAAGFVDPIFSIGVVMALYSGQLAAWAIDRSLQRPAHQTVYRKLFENQMRGRYELARTMALPVSNGATDAPDSAKTYFGFFSTTEKELMWSAASMTTRSGNLVRTGGDGSAPTVLKRRRLDSLRFA
jgi:flavin-dependent dehydrogenase